MKTTEDASGGGDAVTMQLQFNTITVNGAELHYVERGTGDPVVLVHGGGATDLRTWGGQLDPLAARYHVIAYSQRYHYPNTWAGDGSDVYSTRTHVADLAALIRGLRLAPCHVVGSSYGGDIALLLAAQRPELVRTLVLGEPGLTLWLRRLPGGEALLQAYIDTIEPAARAVQEGDRETAARLFSDGVLGSGVFEQLSSATRARLKDNARLLAFERPELDDSPFSCADAGRIAAPTLLLTGDRSPAMFGLVAEELGRCMPGCEQATIPNASHLLHGMNPQVYSEAVLAFLERR
jgi:pimeloyl-ACP methyl ester carboxylesterase